MAEPEPEQASTLSNASAEPEAKFPEPSPGVKEEPVPEWSTAVVEWGAAWEVHLYGLGVIFILTAFYGFLSILRMGRTTGHKKVHIVNFGLLTGFGLSRGLFLVIDGYRYKQMLPPIAVKLLWGVGQPCIITAYSLLFLVLKNALVMRQRFKSWYTMKNITLTALPYFVFVGVAEMIVGFIPSLELLTFVCQLLYVLLTFSLLLFYSVVARILWKKKRRVQSEMNGTGRRSVRESKFQSMLVVCYMAILGGASLCVTQLYGMVGVYGVFSNASSVAPWPWYAFNTTQRILELYMTILLLWILSNSSNSSSTDGNQNISSTNNRSLENPREMADISLERHSNRKDLSGNGTTPELTFPCSAMPEIHM